MEITKEMIEKELGYEINKFKLEPLYENGECIGLNVNVGPKRKLEFINTTITIGKSSDFNTKPKVKKGDYNYEKWVAIVDFVGVIDQDKRDWLINYFQSMEDALSWTPPFPDTPPKLFDDKNDE